MENHGRDRDQNPDGPSAQTIHVPGDLLSLVGGEVSIRWSTFDPSEVDTSGDSTLLEELVTYRDNLPELLMHHKGRFVLIKGHSIEGVFATMTEALEAGAERYGTEPALIKQIVETEHFLSPGGILP